jgi:hypothetical protein
MTETSTTETFTPATDPGKHLDDRTITAKWNVGHADEDGWQPQARLVVTHWKSTRRYEATLRVAREKTEARDGMTVVSELHNLSAMASKVVILEQDASRFNRNMLNAVYENALALLRSRFENGEDAVTAYFDPTSVEHAA